MRSSLIVVVLACLGSPAMAQERESVGPAVSGGGPPERIVLPVVQPGCAPVGKEDEAIQVCGRRENPYRIDPVVLAVEQLRTDRNKRPPNRGDVPAEPCNLIGPATPCPSNVIPVSSIALTAVTALVKAVKGEDLRPMLRAEPSEYELYQAAKAEVEARE